MTPEELRAVYEDRMRDVRERAAALQQLDMLARRARVLAELARRA